MTIIINHDVVKMNNRPNEKLELKCGGLANFFFQWYFGTTGHLASQLSERNMCISIFTTIDILNEKKKALMWRAVICNVGCLKIFVFNVREVSVRWTGKCVCVYMCVCSDVPVSAFCLKSDVALSGLLQELFSVSLEMTERKRNRQTERERQIDRERGDSTVSRTYSNSLI